MGLLKGTSVDGVNTVTLDTKVVKLSGLLPGTATGDAVTYEQLSGSFDPVFDDLTADTITVGSIVLQNATNANTLTIQSGVTSASYSLTLPTAQGSANTVLTNNGSGVLSWTAPSSGITVGTTTITSGTTGSVLMDIGGIVTESASYRAQQASPGGTAFGYNASYGAGTDGYGTVVGNTVYGYEASPSMNVTGRNTFIGYRAGYAYTTGSSGLGGNTFVGWSAGVANGNSLATTLIGANISCANYSTAVGIGYACIVGGDQAIVIGQASASAYSVSIGHEAAATGNYNASIGYQAGKTNTGSYNTFLNTGAFSSTSISGSIGIGYRAIPSSNNTCVIGGNNSNGMISDVYFNGTTHTSAYSVVLNACGGLGTNNPGASITRAAGKGTGTAAGGNNVEQTSVKTSSGTTLQALTDRHNIVGKYVDITGGAATTFGNLALATSSTIAGGIIVYTVEANDGTDFQSLTGSAPYSVVNKAGALTYVLGTDVQSSACSSGTLTGTLSLTASGTTMSFQMNAVSSLVETVLRVSFQVINNFGVATITAA